MTTIEALRSRRTIHNFLPDPPDESIILEAIESATALAPETLGPQAPRAGILTEGYDSDVIALDTNPLDDRSVWGNPARVTHVWKGGSLEKTPA